MKKTQVLIIGAGFAGLNAAKALAQNPQVKITLVDRRNHHLFQPLLYQVATAGLSPADIASPIRNLFKNYSNVEVLLDEAIAIRASRKVVEFRDEVIGYDYLIVACGANHSYFGKDQWEAFAPGLKTLEQATEIRRRILVAFEEAEKIENPAERESRLNFVIVGGGPTGVEMAGAIAELSRNTIAGDYRKIDPSKSRVILIEAGSRLLAAFDPKLSDRSKKDLEELGVEVRLNTRVIEVESDGVKLESEFIKSKTVVWAAGVAPSMLGQTLGTPLDQAGRVIVENDLSLRDHPEIFVLGDQANFKGVDGKPLPGLAPVAIQQGHHVAENILLRIAGRSTKPFSYLDKGIMATIGRKKAVIQVGKIKFGGLIAWFGWLFIHIYYLIGFKNRMFVMLQWVWSYFTFSRGARLIVDKDWKLKK